MRSRYVPARVIAGRSGERTSGGLWGSGSWAPYCRSSCCSRSHSSVNFAASALDGEMTEAFSVIPAAGL